LIKNAIARVEQGSPMKMLGIRQLSLMLIGTLLFCHGVFGSLHLHCFPPLCAGGAEHAAEHQAAGGAMVGEEHEHSAGHGTSTGYFAVLVGLLGLFLGLLPKGAPLRVGLGARWPAALRWVPTVMSPPPTPTPLTLQVFRL
jgi:hypothetical protein